MKKIIIATAVLFSSLFLGVFIYNIAPTLAITTPNPNQNAGQALEIAPPVLNLKADPGETIQAKISLRDVSTTSLLVTNEINDFTAVGEDGTPKVIMNVGNKEKETVRAGFQAASYRFCGPVCPNAHCLCADLRAAAK